MNPRGILLLPLLSERSRVETEDREESNHHARFNRVGECPRQGRHYVLDDDVAKRENNSANGCDHQCVVQEADGGLPKEPGWFVDFIVFQLDSRHFLRILRVVHCCSYSRGRWTSIFNNKYIIKSIYMKQCRINKKIEL